MSLNLGSIGRALERMGIKLEKEAKKKAPRKSRKKRKRK